MENIQGELRIQESVQHRSSTYQEESYQF